MAFLNVDSLISLDATSAQDTGFGGKTHEDLSTFHFYTSFVGQELGIYLAKKGPKHATMNKKLIDVAYNLEKLSIAEI